MTLTYLIVYLKSIINPKVTKDHITFQIDQGQAYIMLFQNRFLTYKFHPAFGKVKINEESDLTDDRFKEILEEKFNIKNLKLEKLKLERFKEE